MKDDLESLYRKLGFYNRELEMLDDAKINIGCGSIVFGDDRDEEVEERMKNIIKRQNTIRRKKQELIERIKILRNHENDLYSNN